MRGEEVTQLLGLVGFAIAVSIFGYLIRNHRRNSDPVNQACAVELCQLAMEADLFTPDPSEVVECFRRHDLNKKQALHVASMIPMAMAPRGIEREVRINYARYVQHLALVDWDNMNIGEL